MKLRAALQEAIKFAKIKNCVVYVHTWNRLEGMVKHFSYNWSFRPIETETNAAETFCVVSPKGQVSRCQITAPVVYESQTGVTPSGNFLLDAVMFYDVSCGTNTKVAARKI